MAPSKTKLPSRPAKKPAGEPIVDKDSIYKEGFLRTVLLEKPTEKGKIVTRFPPEPNGYLHVGHSKAIAINFGLAKHYDGKCFLRFDDTNPEAESDEYVTAAIDIIKWLGFAPCGVTYSSDNFDKLYALAEKLIEKDGAYVCHCSDTEIKLQRGGEDHGPRYACPHRNRPIEESLTEFRAMRDGKYKPREAFLRMKQDLEDGNPQMWDLVAYRILEAHHHRTGDKWRIYPTYDFTHCLCDSIEGITHSLCTTEFELSRVSYEWLCDAVEVYKPMQREFGRLRIDGTMLSKRKIMKLVDEKIVRGWDDPRLYTLIALRRRGIPPGAILAFISELGVSKAVTHIEVARFEQSVRKYLEFTVPRLMLVLDPLPVIIENVNDSPAQEVEIPFDPKNPALGSRKVPITEKVYIERSDFRKVDSDDYYRLAPGKRVGLNKMPYPVVAMRFDEDEKTGHVTSVYARYDIPSSPDGKIAKPKTYIHWVPDHASTSKAEVRVHNALFKSNTPEKAEGGWLNDVNPSSEEIYPNALIDAGFHEIRTRAPWPKEEGEKDMANQDAGFETVRFQGMRVAYFTMDKDSGDGKIVLNRIVTLKEDSGKAS